MEEKFNAGASVMPRQERVTKLGLGTVQFGLDYGISNRNGITPPDEAARILQTAALHKLRVVDTAAQYGTSEEVLGQCLGETNPFQIVTKIPKFTGPTIGQADVEWMGDVFAQSLVKLRQPALYGVMLHSADDALADGGQLIMERLKMLKERGLARKVGVSVYTAEQIDRVMDRYEIDIIQVPVNIFDQRLLASGHLRGLRKAGVEVHARSVFLQGLLLMKPERLPSYFDRFKQHIERFHSDLDRLGLEPLAAALSFVHGLEEIDTVICGVNNSTQLEQLIGALQQPLTSCLDPSVYASEDAELLNPAMWHR